MKAAYMLTSHYNHKNINFFLAAENLAITQTFGGLDFRNCKQFSLQEAEKVGQINLFRYLQNTLNVDFLTLLGSLRLQSFYATLNPASVCPALYIQKEDARPELIYVQEKDNQLVIVSEFDPAYTRLGTITDGVLLSMGITDIKEQAHFKECVQDSL